MPGLPEDRKTPQDAAGRRKTPQVLGCRKTPLDAFNYAAEWHWTPQSTLLITGAQYVYRIITRFYDRPTCNVVAQRTFFLVV